MKIKVLIYSTFTVAGLLLHSCSEENEQFTPILNEKVETRTIEESPIEGRFDSIPFQWDYSFSTDTTQENFDGMYVYPVKIEEVDETRVTTNRPSIPGGERPGGSRPGGTRPRPGTTVKTDQMLISDPNIIYVGAAFPEATFAKDFADEILSPRNPIDLYTNFSDPYIGEITKETGGLGYKKFMKEVINSPEYKKFLQGGGREALDFQCTEVFSYSDIEKALSTNTGFAKIFSAKVQTNSKKTNIKSRLFAQLTSRNFTVTMDLPVNGLFKDKAQNTSTKNPVFVRSLSYGKIALLAIESEYSFEEVKKAAEAGIKFNILSGEGNYTSKDREILQKATVTICVISDETKETQYFDSFDKIKDVFKISYSEYHYGLPILCKGYYTKDHSIFTVTTSIGSGRRPSTGRSN